jgi:gliding motility-associated-like protein
VPNAFTPNGDDNNDYFMPRGINIKKINLLIFNRWGDLIEQIENVSSKGWDGTDRRQGTQCQQEVYNWKLDYTDVFNNERKGIVGTVTLIR